MFILTRYGIIIIAIAGQMDLHPPLMQQIHRFQPMPKPQEAGCLRDDAQIAEAPTSVLLTFSDTTFLVW